MKFCIRRLLLVAGFVVAFTLLSLFPFAQTTNEKQISQNLVPQSQVAGITSPGLPIRLKIPTINVNANIQELGVNSKEEMDVPSNIIDVGWYKLGTVPGEQGNAVIDGHLDGKNGEAGVFANLSKLKKGEKIYIEDDKGTTITFAVRESRAYDPGYAADIFISSNSAHLNLITCNGVWDKNKKSYSKRLVVFADLIRE